ncbi:MAG TPA: alpha/beta hydrolase domain-containing protein [Candidatus Entotheonella sp.]
MTAISRGPRKSWAFIARVCSASCANIPRRSKSSPSLEERYGSHTAYVKQVEEAAQALVDLRLLLPPDAARYVDEATRSDPFVSRT